MTASVLKRVVPLESPLTARAGPYMSLQPAAHSCFLKTGYNAPFHHLCEGIFVNVQQ